jgi:methyl-accepting chemotaxis protein
MTLQQKIVSSISAIGLLVFIGLFIIYQSTSGVLSIAKTQEQLSATQFESVKTLSASASTISPSIKTMTQISKLKSDIAQLRFMYVEASLTLASDDLSRANETFPSTRDQFIAFLIQSGASTSEVEAAREAFWAAQIYGNKINEFRLKDLAMTAGEMAVGLTNEMSKLDAILDEKSLAASTQVNTNLSNAIKAIEDVDKVASETKKGSQEIVFDANSVANTVLIVAVFFVVIAVVITLIVNKSIQKATKQVVTALSLISKDKNLSLRINRQEQDELGEIAHDVDSMMTIFEGVIKEVLVTASGVNKEINAMGERSHGLNTLIDQQRGALDNISDSITQMLASADNVASNASNAMNTTKEVNELGNNSSVVIEDNISSIEALNGLLVDSEDKVSHLANDVASIVNILSVIESIAEQTNLLALNAAIESARAGEHGRGFAVVADEVRGLAKRTQESVAEIKSNIDQLTSRTQEVVNAIQSSRSTSKSSVEQAQQTKASVNEITQSLARISERVHQILEAAKEQAQASHSISARVQDISSKAHEISNTSNQNEMAGERMLEQGQNLAQVCSVFKVTQ